MTAPRPPAPAPAPAPDPATAAATPPAPTAVQAVRVWDLPTRAFHWLLVVCVVGLVITGSVGGAAMPWHGRLGLAVLALLVFRLIWGFAGGHWSRFAQWFPTPGRTLRYLRGASAGAHTPGHNPLGAWSVLALLVLLAAQLASGLMSDDEIAFTGPLTRFVSNDLVGWMTNYHTEVGKLLLIALVVLHVAAIVFYRVVKRDDLVTPMLRGDKPLPMTTPATPASRDDARSRLLALVALAAGLGVAGWVYSLGG